MRSAENGVERRFCRIGILAGTIAVGFLLSGCAAGPSPKEKLAAAYQELDNPAPNYASVIDASDAYLKANPTGPAAADAVTNDLKRQGLMAQRFHDTVRNVQYVRVGPLGTYDSAVAAKQRVLAKYRDAIILP